MSVITTFDWFDIVENRKRTLLRINLSNIIYELCCDNEK